MKKKIARKCAIAPGFDRRGSEASFSLVEVAIAMSIMAFIMASFGRINGNAIYFNEFERNATQATWLAKRVMSQVEYFWKARPFKDVETKVEAVPFQEVGELGGEDGFYKYNLSITEWKLPIIDILAGGGPGADDEEGDSSAGDGGQGDLMKQAIDQVLEGEPLLKIANVEVSWPEGARRNSVTLALLLTNQMKFDQKIALLANDYNRAKNNALGNKKQNQPNSGGNRNTGGNTNAGGGGPGGNNPAGSGGAGDSTNPGGG